MSARFEIVRTDAEQPWHARRIVNGKRTWWTENYSRKVGAQRAIRALVNDLSGGLWVMRRDGNFDLYHAGNEVPSSRVLVREVDERYVPAPVVLEPPFYRGERTEFQGEGRDTKATRVPFWHDHEYHSRHCSDVDCREETPPAGTEIQGRVGSARCAS